MGTPPLLPPHVCPALLIRSRELGGTAPFRFSGEPSGYEDTIDVCASRVLYGHVHSSNRVNIYKVHTPTPQDVDAHLRVANGRPLHRHMTRTDK